MAVTLAEMRMQLRITSEVYDTEITALIEAARADMLRVGIREALVEEDTPLVHQAIVCYVKANFGYDNSEAPRFMESYRQVVCDLLNSPANTAAGE